MLPAPACRQYAQHPRPGVSSRNLAVMPDSTPAGARGVSTQTAPLARARRKTGIEADIWGRQEQTHCPPRAGIGPAAAIDNAGGLARLEGFEPPTNGFGSHYSIRLSYRRVFDR